MSIRKLPWHLASSAAATCARSRTSSATRPGPASRGWGCAGTYLVPFEAPAATIPISIRLLREDDIPHLIGTDDPTLSGTGRLERLNRLNMIRAGFKSCYVAVTADDSPCYMQFLIGPDENDLLRTHFRGLYPTLTPDEALLEGAFTPEAFRGQRIMPCAMAQIAMKAAEFGARWVITYVGSDNIASLKGCQAGWLLSVPGAAGALAPIPPERQFFAPAAEHPLLVRRAGPARTDINPGVTGGRPARLPVLLRTANVQHRRDPAGLGRRDRHDRPGMAGALLRGDTRRALLPAGVDLGLPPRL